jgi:hypothetical protein
MNSMVLLVFRCSMASIAFSISSTETAILMFLICAWSRSKSNELQQNRENFGRFFQAGSGLSGREAKKYAGRKTTF